MSIYSPLIKTTDAEIKGYANLHPSVKDGILPIFELTKSRKTIKDEDGSVEKRLKELLEATGDRPFIADLTTESTLLNKQILKLYDSNAGYYKWREFIKLKLPKNVIPTITVNADEGIGEVTRQAAELEGEGYQVAFRASLFDARSVEYIKAIQAGLQIPENLTVILDGQFLGIGRAPSFVNEIASMISFVIGATEHNFKYIQLSSCFPSSVMSTGYSVNDQQGRFANEDVVANSLIGQLSTLTRQITYGDYGSIHPIRYPTRGGTFVPRVDLPLDTEFLFRRFRREDGGYIRAAQEIVKLPDYKSINTWGDAQIISAANGAPKSFGPVFWIAVRLNIHVTRQYYRLLNL